MTINFRNSGKKEEGKLYIIKYRKRERDIDDPPFEVGSAYFFTNEWWINFTNPFSYNKKLEVLGWADYNFKK